MLGNRESSPILSVRWRPCVLLWPQSEEDPTAIRISCHLETASTTFSACLPLSVHLCCQGSRGAHQTEPERHRLGPFPADNLQAYGGQQLHRNVRRVNGHTTSWGKTKHDIKASDVRMSKLKECCSLTTWFARFFFPIGALVVRQTASRPGRAFWFSPWWFFLFRAANLHLKMFVFKTQTGSAHGAGMYAANGLERHLEGVGVTSLTFLSGRKVSSNCLSGWPFRHDGRGTARTNPPPPGTNM